MIEPNLTAAQLAELRARWVFDEYAAGPPVIAYSVFNRRYARGFFSDDDIEAIARQAARRWGRVIADASPRPTTRASVVSGLGGGFGTGPGGAALLLSQVTADEDGIPVIIYGTVSDVIQYEVIALSSSSVVTTTRTDWDQLLGAEAKDTLVSDVEIYKSGGSALATLTP